MTTYHIWAEHTAGMSDNRPCSEGVWTDPVDRLDLVIEAESEEAAQAAGEASLQELASEYRESCPCPCGRTLRAGTDRWWDSVSVTASRSAYPDYVGDDPAVG